MSRPVVSDKRALVTKEMTGRNSLTGYRLAMPRHAPPKKFGLSGGGLWYNKVVRFGAIVSCHTEAITQCAQGE
ncbi:hypothetical protein RUM44_002325 [Polyplax serrata]|uniref:Uncharacterized protein n=1 Tax=Polyplax serrata TaxID=468196 RepID=A0ABR1AMJ3_POLSC